MATRAKSICRHTGCSRLVDVSGYCEQHAEMAVGWVRSHEGKTSAQRGYGHRWRKLRDAVMARDMRLCQVCLKAGRFTPAVDVDHIVPKADGGTDAMDNLQAICRPCHREKTFRER